MPPYYDLSFFDTIRQVREEGLLNIKTMSSGFWYRSLLETHVTHQPTGSGNELRPCRIERKHSELDWGRSWSLAVTPGLSSKHYSFLWRMVHDLLPTQARLFRLHMPNIESEVCSHCDLNVAGDLPHSIIVCPYNDNAGQYLLEKLHVYIPNLLPQQVVLLDIDVDADLHLPLLFLISSVLSDVWECRKEKKPCHLHSIRAALEAGVNILRKSRHKKAAETITNVLEI